jgi:hypothetical protein
VSLSQASKILKKDELCYKNETKGLPSSNSAHVPRLFGVAEAKTRLLSKDTTKRDIRMLARSATSSKSEWKLSFYQRGYLTLSQTKVEREIEYIHASSSKTIAPNSKPSSLDDLSTELSQLRLLVPSLRRKVWSHHWSIRLEHLSQGLSAQVLG